MTNTWQKWEIDFVVGETTSDLTVDGNAHALDADARSGIVGQWLGMHSRSTGGGYIDDLSVTVVPEPSTAMLLLGGVAILGVCRGRRRRR